MNMTELHPASHQEANSNLVPTSGSQGFKKLLTFLAGGTGEFFPDDVAVSAQTVPVSEVINWAQWEGTEDLREEWSTEATLASMRADRWFARMELGWGDDDLGVTVVAPHSHRILDVPSFISALPQPDTQKNDTGVAEIDPNNVSSTRHLEFVELLTRAELVVGYAESYAASNNKLPSLWRLERIILQDPRHRNLLADPDFRETLRGYEAMWRKDFVGWVKKMTQHPGYRSASHQETRAAYLDRLGAADLTSQPKIQIIESSGYGA